jgi:hypothetical protein
MPVGITGRFVPARQHLSDVLIVEDGDCCRYLSAMKGEPAIVVGDRKELTYLLSQAAELEHALMCEYLYAAFSLKSTAGPGLRADQLAAVERWRGIIFGIAAEEMLHWAMVQNLLSAVGSAPYVSRPHMPHQARGYPPGVQVQLLPFGEAALQHFVYLERPEGMQGADAEGFAPAGLPLPPMRAEEIIPRARISPRSATCTAPLSGVWLTWQTSSARTGCSSARCSSRRTRRTSAGLIFGLSLAWRVPAGPSSASSSRVRGREGTGRMPITAAFWRCSMTTGRCARRIRRSSPPPGRRRRGTRCGGVRAGCLHLRSCHWRVL